MFLESRMDRLAHKHWVKQNPTGGGYVYGGGSGATGRGGVMQKGVNPLQPGGGMQQQQVQAQPTYAPASKWGDAMARLGKVNSNPLQYFNGDINDLFSQSKAGSMPPLPDKGTLNTGQNSYSWGYDTVGFSGHARNPWVDAEHGRPTGAQQGYGGGYGGGSGVRLPGGGSLYGGYPGATGTGVRGINGGTGASGDIGTRLQQDLDKANQKNEDRYQEERNLSKTGNQQQLDQLRSLYGDLQTRIGQNTQQQTDQTKGLYGDLLNRIGGNKSEEKGFLDQNLAKQQGLISGLGGFQKEQNRRLLEKEKGSAAQDYASRGLYNSTLAANKNTDLDTEGAFRDMAVDDANARLGLGVLGQYGQLGADVLARNNTAGINAQGQEAQLLAQILGQGNTAGINAQSQLAQLLNQTMGQGTAQQIGIIEGRSDLPPDLQAYLSLLSSPGGAAALGVGGQFGAPGTVGFAGHRKDDQYASGGGGGGSGAAGLLQQYIDQILGGNGYGGGGQGTQQTVNNTSYLPPYPRQQPGGNTGAPQGTSGGYDQYGNPVSYGPGANPGYGSGGSGGNSYPGMSNDLANQLYGNDYGQGNDSLVGGDFGGQNTTTTGGIGDAYNQLFGQAPAPKGYYGEQPFQGSDGRSYLRGADGRTFVWDGFEYQPV